MSYYNTELHNLLLSKTNIDYLLDAIYNDFRVSARHRDKCRQFLVNTMLHHLSNPEMQFNPVGADEMQECIIYFNKLCYEDFLADLQYQYPGKNLARKPRPKPINREIETPVHLRQPPIPEVALDSESDDQEQFEEIIIIDEAEKDRLIREYTGSVNSNVVTPTLATPTTPTTSIPQHIRQEEFLNYLTNPEILRIFSMVVNLNQMNQSPDNSKSKDKHAMSNVSETISSDAKELTHLLDQQKKKSQKKIPTKIEEEEEDEISESDTDDDNDSDSDENEKSDSSSEEEKEKKEDNDDEDEIEEMREIQEIREEEKAAKQRKKEERRELSGKRDLATLRKALKARRTPQEQGTARPCTKASMAKSLPKAPTSKPSKTKPITETSTQAIKPTTTTSTEKVLKKPTKASTKETIPVDKNQEVKKIVAKIDLENPTEKQIPLLKQHLGELITEEAEHQRNNDKEALERVLQTKSQIRNLIKKIRNKCNDDAKLYEKKASESKQCKRETRRPTDDPNVEYWDLEIDASSNSRIMKEIFWASEDERKISEILLVDYYLPFNGNNVTRLNNIFGVHFNNNINRIVIPTGKYTINKLFNYITSKITFLKFTIDKSSIITIKNTLKLKFDLFTDGDNILPLLGFTETGYKDQISYTASQPFDITANEKLYFSLAGTSMEPIELKFDEEVKLDKILKSVPNGMNQKEIKLAFTNSVKQWYDFLTIFKICLKITYVSK